jgi:hypothetical protein
MKGIEAKLMPESRGLSGIYRNRNKSREIIYFFEKGSS